MKNPFKVEGVVSRKVHKGMKHYKAGGLVDFDDGVVRSVFVPEDARVVWHDSRQFNKVYSDSFSVTRRLSNSCKVLFLYCMQELRINSDLIWLNPADACRECEISKSTFYGAVDELIESKILARKLGSHLEYWINTNIMYNGDRIRLVKKGYKNQ